MRQINTQRPANRPRIRPGAHVPVRTVFEDVIEIELAEIRELERYLAAVRSKAWSE